MTWLPDGGMLYHGSYTEVSVIDLSKCRDGLDFGRGFYLTTDYNQANSFIPSSIKKAKRQGIIEYSFCDTAGRTSLFRYFSDPGLCIQFFDEANVEWLHFVASNRNGLLFSEIKEKYEKTDIVGGKIANDRTAMVLNNYVVGIYGKPGDEKTDQIVIELLEPNNLKDQFFSH